MNPSKQRGFPAEQAALNFHGEIPVILDIQGVWPCQEKVRCPGTTLSVHVAPVAGAGQLCQGNLFLIGANPSGATSAGSQGVRFAVCHVNIPMFVQGSLGRAGKLTLARLRRQLDFVLVYITSRECFTSFGSGLGWKGNVEKMRLSLVVGWM